MGNRAIITFRGNEHIGIYLHWNGGQDSVDAFLKYCELKKYGHSNDYDIARLCQIIGNYFGGNLSLGLQYIDKLNEDAASGLDNGIYVVENWKVVNHLGHLYSREGYNLTEFLINIDNAQPEAEKLGADFIKAEEVEAMELKIGDTVFYQDHNGIVSKHTVLGFANENNMPFGNRPPVGSPYIDKYPDVEERINCNNFLKGKVRRAVKENES